jgi:integrase
MKYYVAGRPVYESTGHEKQTQAQRVLNERLGKIATGQTVLPRLDRVTYAEAVKDLREHYTSSGERDVTEANYRLQHVDAFFGHYRLAAIGPADVTRYTTKRQGEGASNSTVNRELAVLGRMLRLAYENNKLVRLPLIRKLKEAAPRQGFFERHQYEAVRRRLSADLQTAIAVAYTFGWRMQSEVLTLERRHLDLTAGTLRLDPGSTKNGEGRVVYLTPELKSVLAAHVERVDALQRDLGRQRQVAVIIPWLFPHFTGRHRGTQRRDFRKAWARACREAGVPGMLRHDFRRTAVRNMERSGVSRSVATKITGHKTEAIYRRYAIVSDADLRAAAVQIANGDNHGDNRGVPVDARSLSR